MIVATAGHVDHGKTSLVRALTGIDTDRLPEEKRRGLSIDLGFAYLRTPGGASLGFVDVPGHERFVRHMLAGLAAIDFALLVVAADDGPMPQTREHVAILDLLGVTKGAVALTKTDRVSDGRAHEAASEAAALLSATGLAGAPIFPVASPLGTGAPELLRHLEAEAAALASRDPTGAFRLAVDRRFLLPGVGQIVAGAVVSGAVGVGEHLVLAPSGTPVRVRGLHVNGAPAERARAGDRCACNVAPVGRRQIEAARGDWLVDEGAALATRRLDVELRLLASEARALREARIHLHLGAGETAGRVFVIEGEGVQPGGRALAQLLLDREIAAWWGDRFVLRDAAARRTIGGGRVLDPQAPARGRRAPARLAQLEAQRAPLPEIAFAALLEHFPGGVPLEAFRRGRALTPADWARVLEATAPARIGPPAAERGVPEAALRDWRARLLDAVGAWHAREADAIGPGESELFRQLAPGEARPLFAAALAELLRQGALVRDGGQLRLPDWRPSLPEADVRLWRRIEPLLRQGGERPPRLRELAAALDAPLEQIEAVARRAARLGLAVFATRNRAFAPDAMRRLAGIAEQLAAEAAGGTFSAAQYRDRSGVGRNLTIELLEHFDRTGFTRRVGDGRRIGRSADEAFGPASVAGEGPAA